MKPLLAPDTPRSPLLAALAGAVLALTLATSGCGDTAESCTPGTALCACVDNACPGASGLACVDEVCVYPGCDIGSEGCVCTSKNTCDEGLLCDSADTTCEAPDDTCTAGEEGCACVDGACGVSSSGESLACQSDVCVSTSCMPGEAGCRCVDGTTCDADTTCEANYCVSEGCVAGALNCPCQDGVCSGTLVCRDGSVCVDATGYSGGPCNDDGTCERGNACVSGLCSPCLLGIQGCNCTDLGTCVGGSVCMNDSCVDESEATGTVPDDPTCYSTCEQGYLDGTVWRSCDAEGLMEGCRGDLVCTDGSCVVDGDPAPTCEMDYDCPDFQACMNGRCLSNCDADGDCLNGAECYMKVCRWTCTSTDQANCEGATYCELLSDGQTGHCMPEIPSDGTAQTEVLGGVIVDPQSIDLSNIDTEVTFRVTNDSDSFSKIRIRKLEHQLRFDDGTSEDLTDYDDDETCNPALDCPLFWLELGEVGGDDPAAVDELEVVVDANGYVDVMIANGGGSAAVSWTGTLQIISDFGTDTVTLSYAERPDGQWRGTAYYYNFFNDENLAEWAADPANTTLQAKIRNAFMQRWAAFRRGDLTYGVLQAVMTATENATWEAASELADCNFDACYYYDGTSTGIAGYSSDTSLNPVPQGVTELPFAMNLYQPNPTSNPGLLKGRIESSGALHYAGDPAVELTFESTPDDCDVVDADSVCLARIADFEATINVGGRYATSAADTTCADRAGDGYEQYAVPWLLPGFSRNTFTDSDSGLLYRYECRDGVLPVDVGSAADPDLALTENLSLASSNPIPDGRTRRRRLTLLDGVLVNQTTMIIVFQEIMDSFVDEGDSDGIRAYGYLVLEKEATELDTADANTNFVADAFEGSEIVDTRTDPDDLLGVACSADLLEEVLGYNVSLTADNAPQVISAVIDGVISSGSNDLIDTTTAEQVHYYCEDTGRFDGGPYNDTQHGLVYDENNNDCAYALDGACQDGGPNSVSSKCSLGTDFADCGTRYYDDADVREACPAGSRVVFFTVDGTVMDQQDIANQPCQEDRTCQETLNLWRSSAEPLVNLEPTFKCESGGAYCDLNRYDLRDGKQFYAAGETEAVFTPFRAAVASAFRYRIRFQNRSGTSLGFAPEICIENSDQIPYCYDPDGIEALAERVDCLLAIWEDPDLYPTLQTRSDSTSVAAVASLEDFLEFTFAAEEDCVDGDPNRCTTYHGFERLFAELLIMMGDASYTDSFASRFDLAAQSERSFEGELFEDGGINLSGIAGNEMYLLHQAVEYYQESLDRFYSMSKLMWLAVQEDLAEQANPDEDHRASFISPTTVTSYLERMLRASTQKSRAWSQIAERYQSFGEATLARRVIERAYTATYLESVAIGRLMQKIRDSFQASDRPQIEQVLKDGQRRYRMAMLDMRNVYSSITDETQVFGLDPDYIPFPTLNNVNFSEDNAFQKLLNRAKERVSLAKIREDNAISQDRAYDTDAASFQSELTRIRTTYESQLADICGTFTGDDGKIYPAIKKYASLTTLTATMGDPCGLVGKGQLYNAMINVDSVSADVQLFATRYGNALEQIQNEVDRVDAQCDLIDGLAAFTLCSQINESCENVPDDAPNDTSLLTLENLIRTARTTQQAAQRTFQAAQTIAELTKCSTIAGTSTGGDCVFAGIARVGYGIAMVVNEVAQTGAQILIDQTESDISQIQAHNAAYQTEKQCDQIRIDSEAKTKDMVLSLSEINLESLRAQYQLQLALAEISRLHDQATRLQLEQEEVEQMAINVEAARNDPNVRIYKNDAIINADFSFEDALTQVYKATRVFEYYTSQSYAEREQLYLIRMVQYGDYNLENYLIELENAFAEFEEEYGEPDVRVHMISLKNDILNIARTYDDGTAISSADRTALLRAELTDPANLDENGYLTFPFSTRTDQLSPLTRNHKISYIEVDMNVSDWGEDDIGRVYLRQLGTSTVQSVDDEKLFYRFDARQSVVDVFFQGNKNVFDSSIYKSYRFRDRPFANTAWELVINQRDEPVNQDIDLSTLTDIKIYIYYSDFTTF